MVLELQLWVGDIYMYVHHEALITLPAAIKGIVYKTIRASCLNNTMILQKNTKKPL